MTGNHASGYVLNVHQPEIMRSILEQILAIGDVLGRDRSGRTILAVTVDHWLFDELAAFGSDIEHVESEPDEDDVI